MKLSTLFFFSLILFATTACGQSYQNDYYDNNANANNMQQATYNPQTASGQLVMHEVHDPQMGMTSFSLPLPSSWKITTESWKDSNGAEVKTLNAPSFNLQQRPIYSIDQIIQEYILPTFPQGGFQHLGTVDLPEIARKDQQTMAQYWQAMPMEKQHSAKGVEYKDAEGGRGMIIIHFTTFRSQYGGMGNYYVNVLHTKAASHYAQAKNEVLYALANYQPNPQYIAAYNQREQQKSQVAWNNHNAKMQNRWNAFNAHQENMRNLSQIGDIQHEGYMRRSQIQDRMHERTIDGIHEQQAAIDPYTGQQRKVESGYNHYYMNQFGEYIGTNDEFYSPERDPNLNNQEWRKVNNQGGGY